MSPFLASKKSSLARVQRHSYLKQGKVIVLLDLCQEAESDQASDLIINSDISILKDLDKLQWGKLDEKRSMDFIISLWHNWAASGREENKGLTDVIDDFLNMPSLTKANRRKLEFYRKKLLEKLAFIAGQAINKHREKMLALFDHSDPDFPEKRIRTTTSSVKENRTIEYIAIAYDVFRIPRNTLDTLGTLKELDLLTETTEIQTLIKLF